MIKSISLFILLIASSPLDASTTIYYCFSNISFSAIQISLSSSTINIL
ncbi:hypothetical protein CLOSPI_01509 [Thomasclavelia spiroformis DSM 1552]|uniref:Uncharacterized protein n=1 Tax=Thomasclavelia spiroformis DSM 1552 TaxID=428126 RepID=B1C2P7_9FIRM|nr:hypothetical protein CLOSPI_01509 [Thomasclavelia spiroformis DSM 1552]